jgi:cytochrome c553
MKRLLFGSFFLLLLGLSFSISSEFNKGEKLYINHCSACHSLEGMGKGIFPSLTDIVDIIGKEGLFTIIKKGREETGMPAIPSLSDQSLEDIYAYLKTLKKPENMKAEGEEQRTEKTEKANVAAEKKPPKENRNRNVLSEDSLRTLNIPSTERVRAILAYKIASRMPDLFSELPCFCGCGWIDHSSLLDCFRTTHGAKCALCQEEAEMAERLYARHQLLKVNTPQAPPKTLDDLERMRKEEAELNKQIALTLVKLFWKRRAVGGLHEF